MLNRIPALVLFLAIASSVHAQRAEPPSPAGLWKLRFDESSSQLKTGHYDAALKISEKVIRQMIDQLGPGDAAMTAFGIAVTHKALALAGLGREEDALWYWHTVVTLYPAFAESDLSMFGEPGAYLARNRDPHARFGGTPPPPTISGDPRIRPPRVRKRVEVEFAKGARAFGTSGELIADFVVTKDGAVIAPRVLRALPAPTLTYTALEALRRWKIEPGTIDGKPADVIFFLKVHYKLD